MIFVVYRIYDDEPNIGYYWGRWEDPIALAHACYNMYPLGFHGLKIIQYEDDNCIKTTIDLNSD